MNMNLRRRNAETGTVAIVVALSATMIFALAALAVDLGSGFARKRDIQTQADLATLAAAAKLPYSVSRKAAIEAAATAYATKNQVAGQDTATWDFADANRLNGYIEYEGANKLRLFAPTSRVDFWLAPAAGLADGMDVSAVAAAQIESPGVGLPFFISTACGWGQQTILDATAGPSIPPTYVPTLTPTSNPASTVKIKSVSYTPNPVPYPVVPSTVGITIETTSGSGLTDVKEVGFTTEDGVHFTRPINVKGGTTTFDVPLTVLALEKVWWVRLLEDGKKSAPDRWTSSDNAEPFIVGNPTSSIPSASCDSKNSGNFGSLDLSRNDVGQPSRYLVENMALGLQHDLARFPPPLPVPPAGCASDSDAEMDTGTPVEGQLVNCLETDTGSDLAQKATDAFITGTAQGSPARLSATDHPTRAGCDPNEGSSNRVLGDISGDPAINNDVLSCFLKPGVKVGDVTQPSCTGSCVNAISDDIFESPRFFWIPVLHADPSGGAGSYAIVDFRGVFITAQDDNATFADPLPAANPDNGITMSTNGKQIEKIKIRAINPLALPEFSGDPGPGNTVPYLGSGTKVVRLVE